MSVPPNMAGIYASKMMKSEITRADASTHDDFSVALAGNCIYLQHFLCAAHDTSFVKALKHDLEQNSTDGMVKWSKHLKHENPNFSATFQQLVEKLENHFHVEIYQTRLNYYPDGSQWKPFHHDSHAYGGKSLREDFTVGASFGATRELVFLHEPSGATFAFPQRNGDVFAFTSEVNNRFKHGVPKASGKVGERFSIIAWGRRREIMECNGGAIELGKRLGSKNVTDQPLTSNSVKEQIIAQTKALLCVKEEGETVESAETTKKSEKESKSEKKKKNRLQGGVAKKKTVQQK